MNKINMTLTRMTGSMGMFALLVGLGGALGTGAGAAWNALSSISFSWANLIASFTGAAPMGYWYLSRGAAIVAYLLMWLSVVFGLMITNKLGRKWPGGLATVDLHQFVSLLALAFAAFHGLILLGDQYIGYSLAQILVPFTSTDYRPLWVGLGQIGLYVAALVSFSFYVRQYIGHRAWRALHYSSFAVYVMVTLHGLMSGTDSTNLAVRLMYALTAASVVALTAYRIKVTRAQRARRARPALQRSGSEGMGEDAVAAM
ncbi:MAG: hypothetical protein U0822_22285 [Anaerolineae bacterium]